MDERLVAPEARDEVIEGRVYRTMGANEPHALEHTEVTHVFRAYRAPGYRAAVDMLTRATNKTDAAPDVSVFPAERDAATGGRQLEEIGVELADTETTSHVTAKARVLAARGVRRLFYIFVEDRSVHEWDRATEGWRALEADAQIVDRCFTVAIPVRALAGGVLVDDTVVRATLARRHPFIVAEVERGEARGEARGRVEGALRGRREALRTLLTARGLTRTAEHESRIDACDDAASLDAWITRAATATSSDDVFSR